MRNWRVAQICSMYRLKLQISRLSLILFVVRSLDLSYNNIKHLPSLTTQKHIHTIYFVQNKISKIEPGQLDWAADSLKSLELGGNRIRVSAFGLPKRYY